MFTGLIEEIGTIAAVGVNGDGLDLLIAADTILEGIAVDDSIAVDGCCLTVVAHDAETFSVTAVNETLTKTTLAALTVGDRVNLERAMRLGDRLGGHLVQGHVDTTTLVIGRRALPSSTLFDIALPPTATEPLIPVGSITVNGVSLTVADLADDRFTVAIIPHTLAMTTFGTLEVGDRVNLEFDMIGKYVRTLLERGMARPSGTGLRE